MKSGTRQRLYPALAVEGMRKNRQLYLPFLATAGFSAVVFFVLKSLVTSPAVAAIYGAGTTIALLKLGVWLMGIFSACFLLYTHSFLSRRRQKEFGLYYILGMTRGNLLKILLWETLFGYGAALGGGIFLGIALYKLAELTLIHLVQGTVVYTITIDWSAVPATATVFGSIFLVLFLRSALRIAVSNPLELFRREQVGEKPPRANRIFGLLGAGILGAGYYLAITHRTLAGDDNLRYLCMAVGLVIAGTYLLFLAGSVAICRLLQKNKGYYYRREHFVSVSSMVYRMKRNGGGLASICILLTMVLVMLSAGVSLLVGTESMLAACYPETFALTIVSADPLTEEEQQSALDWIGERLTVTESNAFSYVGFDAYLKDGQLTFDDFDYDYACEVCVVDTATYQRVSGSVAAPGEGEALVSMVGATLRGSTLEIPLVGSYAVTEWVEMPAVVYAALQGSGYRLLIVVDDLADFAALVAQSDSSYLFAYYTWRYGYDVAEDAEAQAAAYENDTALYHTLSEEISALRAVQWVYAQNQRSEYYSLYGGVFFLGGLLSGVFLLAAVLMIYYKQISEGYEDAPRFRVMQKIGMTGRDIRKNINGQMLLVFFLPVGLAGMHMLFAFPMLKTLLTLFSLSDVRLLVCCTLGCYAAVAGMYALVYRITSNTYYRLVQLNI